MPGTALERHVPTRHLPAGAAPAQVDFRELCLRANVLAKAHTVIPKAFHDNPQAIVFVGMRGGELGFSLGYSIENIDIIEGKAVPNAQARLTIIRREKHDARWGTCNASEATIRVRRKEYRDDPDAWVTYTYTIEDAIRAELATLWVERKYRKDGDRYDRTEKYVVGDVVNGLNPDLVDAATAAAEADFAARLEDDSVKTKPSKPNLWVQREVAAGRIKSKDNWRKDPPAMLRARCITTVSRMEFSDVMAGHAIDPYEEPADERGITEDDELGQDFGEQIARAAAAPKVDDSQIDVDAIYAEHGVEDAVLVDPSDKGGEDDAPAPETGPGGGGGEPEGDPPAPKEAPPADATDEPWPPDLPPEAEAADEPLVDNNWVQRFAITCRQAGLSDEERHALVHQATAGRVASGKQVRVSEIPAVRDWFAKLTAAEPDYIFKDVDGSVVIVPRSPEGDTASQLPLAGGEAA